MSGALQGKLPLITFGSVEDFTTWTRSGTGSEAGGATDPFGGTSAYTLTDSDATATVVWDSADFALVPNAEGEAIVSIFVKQGTANGPGSIGLFDTTAATMRHRVSLTWSGGVPTAATQSGSGTVYPVISCGNGWYLVRFSAANIVSGNNHDLRIQADNSAVADTGTILVYGQSVIVFGLHVVEALAWSHPRDGSEVVTAQSGVADAWITGRDRRLAGRVRWIDGLDVNAPHNRTGWDGEREHKMVNVGWDSLIEYGQDMQTIRFTPDSAACSSHNHTCYLERPEQRDRPGLEEDTTREFDIELRDANDASFIGY